MNKLYRNHLEEIIEEKTIYTIVTKNKLSINFKYKLQILVQNTTENLRGKIHNFLNIKKTKYKNVNSQKTQKHIFFSATGQGDFKFLMEKINSKEYEELDLSY